MVKQPGKVTVKEIAQKAGYSPSAVSFVLSNTYKKRGISEPTAEKIRKTARKMGYLPDIAARNLRSGNSSKQNVVISILTSTKSPLMLINHIHEALNKLIHRRSLNYTFTINIAGFTPGKLKEFPGLLDGKQFNAAIITNTTPEDDSFLESISLPYPSLVIAREIPGYFCFVPSHYAGNVAFRALDEAGVRDPVIIRPKLLTQSTLRRVQNFTKQMEEKHEKKPVSVITRTYSEKAALKSMDTFLSRGGKLDGLFAVQDFLAVGAYVALKKHNLNIPEEVKVIGIGDSDWAPYLDPPLSCAGAEENRVYEKAADMILKQLTGEYDKPFIARTKARYIKRGSI